MYNTFGEPVLLEEEGLTRADLDPEVVVIFCEDCGIQVYPLDWIYKEISHGDTLVGCEKTCIRCLASTRKVMKAEECLYCNKQKKTK